MKNCIKYILFFFIFPVQSYSQIMHNYVTEKENIFTIGVSNNNYLGVNYKPNKRINLYTDHSFFVEKIEYQLFNFGIKYSIINKTNFDLKIQNSIFWNYRNLAPLYYLSPEFVFKNKYYYLSLQLNLHRNFLAEPKYNLQLQIPLINSLIINNYIKQSRHSYYTSTDHKLYGSELLYTQKNLTARVGFEVPQDLNIQFIQFKIGIIIFFNLE